jgi:hypothetical protein
LTYDAGQGRQLARGCRGGLKAGQAMVLLPPKQGKAKDTPGAYIAPLRQVLIDDNAGHGNVVVSEADYRVLRIEHLPPPLQ